MNTEVTVHPKLAHYGLVRNSLNRAMPGYPLRSILKNWLRRAKPAHRLGNCTSVPWPENSLPAEPFDPRTHF